MTKTKTKAQSMALNTRTNMNEMNNKEKGIRTFPLSRLSLQFAQHKLDQPITIAKESLSSFNITD